MNYQFNPLDNDIYKFYMQMASMKCFPEAYGVWKFYNRNPKTKFTEEFVACLKSKLHEAPYVRFNDLSVLKETGVFEQWYLDFLYDFRYSTDGIVFDLDEEGNFELTVEGLIYNKILWEVPLLAMISEAYFETIDTDWTINQQFEKANAKAEKLFYNNCLFADFGTRRRRSFQTQEIVVGAFSNFDNFVGTSNVLLASEYDVKPIGTMAHEWYMINSALCGLRHANKFALENWTKVYGGKLGIALPDTFGSDAFFNDFDLKLAKTFDGIRHDSSCPFEFGEKIIKHYGKLNINPLHKTIVFSDSLDVERAIEIQQCFKDRINCSFGIGTHFTNDFEDSPALNIVIKLDSVNRIPVVKLGDGQGKACGDKRAVENARWTFGLN